MTALIARLIGVLGALAAVVTLGALAAAPELPGLRTLGLTAAVGLGGWLYLDWPAVSSWVRSRGGLEAARAALLVLLGGAILSVAVALVSRADPRWDLSPGGRHSVTSQTAAILATLDGPPIEVTGFFMAAGDPVAVRHRAHWDALADAFAAAGPSLVVRTFDPDVSRREADQAGVTDNGVVLISRGARKERLYAPDERTLVTAIVRVARERTRAVYVSAGHGERPLDTVSGLSLTDLSAELRALGLAVRPLDVSRTEIPDDAAVLIVADPSLPLAQAAAEQIDDWLDGGGALLVAAEPGRDTGLGPLLAASGLALGPGLVVDPLVRSVTGDASTPMVARYGLHASVRGLRTPAVFLGASPVIEAPHAPTEVTVHRLAETSELAWAESNPGEQPLTQGAGDAAGPITLLALSERHPSGRSAGTIVLAGDADWLANDGMRNPGNRDLAVRLLGALANEQDLIELPPRDLPQGSLAMDWLDQVVVGLVALLGIPGLCLGVAAGLWIRRRGM